MMKDKVGVEENIMKMVAELFPDDYADYVDLFEGLYNLSRGRIKVGVRKIA